MATINLAPILQPINHQSAPKPLDVSVAQPAWLPGLSMRHGRSRLRMPLATYIELEASDYMFVQ